MNIALRPNNGTAAWWQDPKKVSLVKRIAAKACNNDEFDEFVAVASDLNLSPLRKQLYAFVFNADKPDKRSMVIVVGIDGGRSIAARSGNYQPDEHGPSWVFSAKAKNPLTNPHGIVKCTVGVFHRPTRNDPFRRIVHTVFWDEFAPLVEAGDSDDYEWVDTGEVWEDSGKPKKRKKLRRGATKQMRLDPFKEQWIRAGRNQIAKCAEMGALRKGWPEDLSRIVVEEETHKAQTLEGGEFGYSDLTPSEMAAKGDADKRMELIGGPAILASLDPRGALERVLIGKFADRVIDATKGLPPEQVASFMIRNRVALQEFWGHNKTDALALKKVLERRSVGAKVPTEDEQARDMIVADIVKLQDMADCFEFAKRLEAVIARLPPKEQGEVRRAFAKRQGDLKGD
jgi:phage recombination protein Bet